MRSVAMAVVLVIGGLCGYCPVAHAADSSPDEEDATWDLSLEKGLRVTNHASDIEFRIGGRLHLDAAQFQEDLSLIDDDTQVRRARTYIAGKIGQRWRFRVEREFASGREGWRNLWAQYRFSNKVWLKAGNFVAPFGMEDVAASNHATFMERALPSAIAPSFQTGLGFGVRGKIGDVRRRHHYSWAVSVGGEPLGDEENDRHRTKHQSLTTRFTYAPFARSKRLLHFGASIEHRKLDSRSLYRTRTRPESSLAPALLNTGLLSDVDSTLSTGLESALSWGSLSAQAEYMRTSLSRDAGRPDPTFDGWYGQLSYTLTGEHRIYSRSTGSFRGIKPRGRWGAVELAARYSELDLIDETVRGGRAKDMTIGINWYLRDGVRLMFNYVKVDAKRRSDLQDDDPEIFQFRLLAFL